MARNEEVRNLTSSSLVSLSPLPGPSLLIVHAVEHHQLRKFLVITDNHDVYAEPLIL